MRYMLFLWIFTISLGVFASNTQPETITDKVITENDFVTIETPSFDIDIHAIQQVLQQHTDTLSQDVINTVVAILQCANNSDKFQKSILTIIDYSRPSSEKRLWVFDLKAKSLLFHTYVSHGKKSGIHVPNFFSNKSNSRASSLGVFSTENSYNGRYGLGLRLQGLEKNFNHNAYNRAIVIHPAWYVNEEFIRKYGRIGRSWGCPALPYSLIEPIVNTIKDQSLLVVYYPSYKWLLQSNFLTCANISLAKTIQHIETMPNSARNEPRDAVLFADKNNNNKREPNEPVVVMTAENYQQIYQTNAPLGRMLRRQMNNTEYIVLNEQELKMLDTNFDKVINHLDQYGLRVLDFVIAEVKKVRNYYATEFISARESKPKQIHLNDPQPVLSTSKTNTNIKSTKKFIRWLGL